MGLAHLALSVSKFFMRWVAISLTVMLRFKVLVTVATLPGVNPFYLWPFGLGGAKGTVGTASGAGAVVLVGKSEKRGCFLGALRGSSS